MVGGVQFQGSSCSSLVIGVSAMRARTSASHACGSMSLSFAVVISVAMKAARSAPRSDPAKSRDFLPSAKPLSARSAALFVREILPSSGNDVKPSQHLSFSRSPLRPENCVTALTARFEARPANRRRAADFPCGDVPGVGRP